jgi:tartrate-resistant acid phosphatase type 5
MPRVNLLGLFLGLGLSLGLGLGLGLGESVAPNFLSVGDWGSAALGGYHLRNAQDTSSAMKAYITEKTRLGQDPPMFVLNTGDNFYYCGIQNTSDPQISEDYTALFGGMGLTWYHSLGNHDYGFSPEAQLALNTTIPGWIMDGRYYYRRVSVSSSIIVNIIVLDTNPCVRDYRGIDRRRWDPCGTQYPDCSPIAEPCRFHDNIIAQDCDAQLEWAKTVLASIPSNHTEWVFVVGHHKAEEIDAADFQSAFLDDPRIHLYLNGHTHNLEHYEINGQAKYMTTGAGGMVMIGGEGEGGGAERLSPHHHHHQSNHTVKSLWSKVVTGFTSHTFMNDGTAMRTEFWDAKKNETVYSFDVHL